MTAAYAPVLARDMGTTAGQDNADKAAMQALGQAPAGANDAGALVSKRAVSATVSTGKPIKGTP